MGPFAIERVAAPGAVLRVLPLMLWMLLLVPSLVASPGHAVPLDNPISAFPDYFLDDPRFQPLSEAAGDYTVQVLAGNNAGFVNQAGGVFNAQARVTFNEVGVGNFLEGGSSSGVGEVSGQGTSQSIFATAMLVLTSIRLGSPSGPVGCPVSGSLPLAPAGFIPDSAGGDASGPAFLVGDAGFVCDDEGDTFLAIPVDARDGVRNDLTFSIGLFDTLTDALYLQYRAFVVVPEPATGTLVLAGLVGLAARARRR